MGRKLSVLMLEDNEDDALLLLRMLRQGGFDVTYERVETEAAMERALGAGVWDLVISDYAMPGFDAPAALRVLHRSGIDIPFLIVSGTIGEETAVDALKSGAHDFLVKGRLARLVPVIERELREAAIRREQRRGELALRESEERYRRIVETTHEGIWALDASGQTTYVNRRMAEMLGVSANAVLGRSAFELVERPGDSILQHALLQAGLGVQEQVEVKLVRADSAELWASVSATAVFSDGGAYAGAFAMVTDVTERRELQAQLMMADRMASVGTLAAGVAHEINNPLTAVLANLDIAMRDLKSVPQAAGPDEGDLYDVISSAQEAAERVRQIVRDIKIFSRAEEDSRGAVNVHNVIESSLRMAWNEVRHRARLVKGLESVPLVEGNEARLGQVIVNLVVNAAQAIPEGHAEQNEIAVNTRVDEQGWAVIEVRDTGSGIPADILRKLFAPFVTTKPPGVGTGLGLAICHRIISDFGGSIGVESEVGTGSTFSVRLPPAGPSAVPQRMVSHFSTTAVAGRRGRVLIVDDEPLVATAVRRTLMRDHEVIVTTRAEEAVSLIERGQRFDVILCDLMMPEMTGMDLHAVLRNVAPDQVERVVFLTGGAFTARAREFLDEVSNERIDKPFNADLLRSLVNSRIR